MAKRELIELATLHPKTLLIGVFAPYNTCADQDYYFEEFLSLVETLGLSYDETYFVKVRQVDKNNFFTKGKLQELVDFVQEQDFEQIIFSEILSPLQERNLEDLLNCTVFDRERLILDIFKNAAKTSEGKIQVEMAEINFTKTRLTGKGKEYAQQAGFIGGRGPGETIKEEIKRHLAEKLRQSQKRLDTLQKARETQRKQRLKQKLPLLCLVGYTNAGKSSLLNRLTKSNVEAEDKLFATLDTTIRELFLSADKKMLISDTVGFITQLPHSLIEAFTSTLDELRYANLLLHVIDISAPDWKHHISVVHETLKEINVDKPMLYIFNKIDKLSEEEQEKLEEVVAPYQPHVCISTLSKEGVSPLLAFLQGYGTAIAQEEV